MIVDRLTQLTWVPLKQAPALLRPAGPVTVSGEVSAVRFRSPDSAFTVLSFTATDGEEITAVGAVDAVVGQPLCLQGRWSVHPQYGEQFQVESYTVLTPATSEGLIRYLGSGLIRGVGPALAGRIVAHFGRRTLELLDQAAEGDCRLLCVVKGIGQSKAATIAAAWREQKNAQEAMIYLQGLGLSAALAARITRRYGQQAIQVVQENPYALTSEVLGIGFQTADQVAQRSGFSPESAFRVRAGLLHVLRVGAGAGQMFMLQGELLAQTAQLLGQPHERVQAEIEVLAGLGEIVRDDALPGTIAVPVYAASLYEWEVRAAHSLRAIIASSPAAPLAGARWDQLCQQVPALGSASGLTARQREAVQALLESKLSVVTGGPGTGKTTTMRAVLDMCAVIRARCALCAPTGRAAKRLSEATGREASTIHRLLGFIPQLGFSYNASNPLPVDVLVADEASMLDTWLARHLFAALAPETHVLLVGDTDQLPPVGPGDVLRDIISSGVARVTRLDVIFRQSSVSQIVANAHRVNRGEFPRFATNGGDCFFFPCDDPARAAALAVELVQSRIPRQFGLAPGAIQVLAPMHKGAAGVRALNARLQAALNPPVPGQAEWLSRGAALRVGDRVMQLRNNYDKGVFNGDLGRVTRVDVDEEDGTSTIAVDFDSLAVEYDHDEFSELALAYATTIHKSQGGEYPAVVVLLLASHYIMLARNLLYTALTRAQQLVVVVGEKRAIGMALANNRPAQRNSGLWRRLQENGHGD